VDCALQMAKRMGIELYVALREPNFLQTVQTKIAEQLERAASLLVIYTADAARSPYVNMEVGRAIALGKPVVTLLPDGQNMVGWLEGREFIKLDTDHPAEAIGRAFDHMLTILRQPTAAKSQTTPAGAVDALLSDLPVAPKSFTGRKRELKRLGDLVVPGSFTVVSGIVGIGKTALCIKFAESLSGNQLSGARYTTGQLVQRVCGEPMPGPSLAAMIRLGRQLLVVDDIDEASRSAQDRFLSFVPPTVAVLATASSDSWPHTPVVRSMPLQGLSPKDTALLLSRASHPARYNGEAWKWHRLCDATQGYPFAIVSAGSVLAAGLPAEAITQGLASITEEPVKAALQLSLSRLPSSAQSLLRKLAVLVRAPVNVVQRAAESGSDLVNLVGLGFVYARDGMVDLPDALSQVILRGMTKEEQEAIAQPFKEGPLRRLRQRACPLLS